MSHENDTLLQLCERIAWKALWYNSRCPIVRLLPPPSLQDWQVLGASNSAFSSLT